MSSRSMPRSRQPDVVARLALVEQLLEHLDAGDDHLAGGVDADDLDLLADLDHAALDAPGGDGAAALDAEHVLDRHQERLVDGALGVGDVGVDRVHQLLDAGVGRVVDVAGGLEGLERGAADDRDVVAREVVLGQQLADLELDEVEQLGVVDRVALVEEHDHVGHLDLAGQEDVLAGLGHRAVGGGDHEDRAVHLGGAGDHVLDVVGVPGAVDVRVVAVRRLVLDVGDRDRDAALALLGGVVDRVEGAVLRAALEGEVLGDGGRERRLAVVDVADRADVHVRLRALELLLGHVRLDSRAARSRWGEPTLLDLRLGDELGREVRGNLGVVAELHGVAGSTLGHRPQVGGVPEHLGRAGPRCGRPASTRGGPCPRSARAGC